MAEEFRKKRLELGKTIEEISNETKIKKSYLLAIEESRFEELPVEVYSRYYIKIYAQLLGIDPKKTLEEYEDYLKRTKEKTKKIEIVDAQKKSKNNFLNRLPQWGITLTIAICCFFLIFLINQITKKKEFLPPPPPLTEEIKETPKVEENTTVSETKPQEQILIVEAIDRVWMRITLDNKEKKEFLLNPGEKIELKAHNAFKLHIGNAGGVKISFNGKELGQLGKIGQVVYLDLPQDRN